MRACEGANPDESDAHQSMTLFSHGNRERYPIDLLGVAGAAATGPYFRRHVAPVLPRPLRHPAARARHRSSWSPRPCGARRSDGRRATPTGRFAPPTTAGSPCRAVSAPSSSRRGWGTSAISWSPRTATSSPTSTGAGSSRSGTRPVTASPTSFVSSAAPGGTGIALTQSLPVLQHRRRRVPVRVERRPARADRLPPRRSWPVCRPTAITPPRASPSTRGQPVREHRVGHEQLPGAQPGPPLPRAGSVRRARDPGRHLALRGRSSGAAIRRRRALGHRAPQHGRAAGRSPSTARSTGRLTAATSSPTTGGTPTSAARRTRARSSGGSTGATTTAGRIATTTSMPARWCSRRSTAVTGGKCVAVRRRKPPLAVYPGALGSDGHRLRPGARDGQHVRRGRLHRVPRLVESRPVAAGGLPCGLATAAGRRAVGPVPDDHAGRPRIRRGSGPRVSPSARTARCTSAPTPIKRSGAFSAIRVPRAPGRAK